MTRNFAVEGVGDLKAYIVHFVFVLAGLQRLLPLFPYHGDKYITLRKGSFQYLLKIHPRLDGTHIHEYVFRAYLVPQTLAQGQGKVPAVLAAITYEYLHGQSLVRRSFPTRVSSVRI